MPDAELLELRRRYEASGDPEAERRLLTALRRRGHVDDALLGLAARCGSAAAEALLDGARPLGGGRAVYELLWALVERAGDHAWEALAWAALEQERARPVPAPAELLGALEALLSEPTPDRLQRLQQAFDALPTGGEVNPRLVELARTLLRAGDPRAVGALHGLTRRIIRFELAPAELRARLLGWVRSGPLAGPSVVDVCRQRDGRELRLTLVASPPFAASLTQLVRWLERAGVTDVLRLAPSAEPLELLGSGAVAPQVTFQRLAAHGDWRRRLGFKVLFTERSDTHDWFARHERGLAVVHVDRFARKTLETPNLVFAAHMLVKKALDMGLERWARWAAPGEPGWSHPFHETSRGCLFDLCKQKLELDRRIRAGRICGDCRQTLLDERGVSRAILGAVERVLAEGRRQVLEGRA
jgi:hypothetical protein